MHRKPDSELLPLDLEIERTLRKQRQLKSFQAKDMAENQNQNNRDVVPNAQECTLGDYWRPIATENYFGIRRQPIDVNNFEIKLSLISMVQHHHFGRHLSENHNAHISTFLDLCDTIKMNGVPHDVIKLRFFPFLLKDKVNN